MQLYTSLVQLKQAMNGGTLPPMTPVTGDALTIIDPAFTIGLGALEEDSERGLRCPVRGCGKYFHCLTLHCDSAHRSIGGCAAVRRALSIPQTAKLSSAARIGRLRMLATNRAGLISGRRLGRRSSSSHSRRKAGAMASSTKLTVGAKNLLNRCTAQLSHKLIDLEHSIGRSPSMAEARALVGAGFVSSVEQTFGSWNAAKGACGLAAFKRGGRREWQRGAVLESLDAWYQEHKALPLQRDASSPTRTPLIPHRDTILAALGTSSWPEAMRVAAAILNIYGGRYGLPVRATQETAAD